MDEIPMPLKNLYLTIPVGETVRDFLVLGTVGRLLDLLPDFRVVILSPAYNVPEFLALCPKDERVVARRVSHRSIKLMASLRCNFLL